MPPVPPSGNSTAHSPLPRMCKTQRPLHSERHLRKALFVLSSVCVRLRHDPAGSQLALPFHVYRQ